MKMLQAYMILPAFYLFYLIAFQAKWRRKIILLIGSTAVLAVVSLSWAVTVDSIPEDERPYIGSSETNSVMELAFGYNGLARLTGQQNTAGNAGMPNGMGQGDNRGNRGDSSSGPNQTGSDVPGVGQDVNAPNNDNMSGSNGLNTMGGMNGSNGNFPNRQMPNDMEMPNGRDFGGGMGGMFGTGRKVLCVCSRLNCQAKLAGFCQLCCLDALPYLQD